MRERAFTCHYHPAAMLFPPLQLKILYETLIGDLRAIVIAFDTFLMFIIRTSTCTAQVVLKCFSHTFSMWGLFLPHSTETYFISS